MRETVERNVPALFLAAPARSMSVSLLFPPAQADTPAISHRTATGKQPYLQIALNANYIVLLRRGSIV